jgi:hypothetical protein
MGTSEVRDSIERNRRIFHLSEESSVNLTSAGKPDFTTKSINFSFDKIHEF